MDTWDILPVQTSSLTINCNDTTQDITITEPSLLTLKKHCQAQFKAHLFIPIFHDEYAKIEQQRIRFNF